MIDDHEDKMMTNSQDRNPVELLAEEFLGRIRRGERPAFSEYTDKYPEFADEIRELFPVLVEMEDVRSLDDSAASQTDTVKTPDLKQLGDYRIIREIGRGGMGIVYEAEQVSLGRHVALKVLPSELLKHPKQRSRFEREAKAAARLHHTNIVPVFGVGENDGRVYYVMQFIQGLALDAVLQELKGLVNGADGSGASPPPCEVRLSHDPSVEGIAQSLMTGWFEQRAETDGGRGQLRVDETIDLPSGASRGGGASSPVENGEASVGGRLSESISNSRSSVVLPGAASGLSHASSEQQNRWTSVAQIGLQVAEALEYAHAQGVLHRDIKPANLLLDIHGMVWITDFGLAKLEDERNLTQTGDVLGTLRYMAPETLKGQSDARSEIYGLGLTLYELLALRPAFDQSSRVSLADQVIKAQFDSLGQINPEIPIDLQTIVHKTIERDPVDRYQTAGELAADLQRFVNDEPIKARRISLAERLMRWSRHNRQLATSLGAVAVLIILLTGGSSFAALYFQGLSQRLHESVADLTIATTELETASEDAKQQAAENLRLAQAAEESRQETETTLADMHTERGLLAAKNGDAATAALWFANAALLAPHDPNRQLANQTRSRNWLQETAVPVARLDVPDGDVRRLLFQPQGELLLTLNAFGMRIWDWELEQSLSWTEQFTGVTDARWSPDGQTVAIGFESGDVHIHEHRSGSLIRKFQSTGGVGAVRWSPNGQQIAVAGVGVQVWNVTKDPEQAHDWPHPQRVNALRFNRAGDRLVTVCRDKQARVFAVDSSENATPIFTVVDHAPDAPNAPVFYDGDRKLVTVTGNGEPQCWDLVTGKEVTPELHDSKVNCRVLATNSDGTWVACAGGHSCVVWSPTGDRFVLQHRNRVNDVKFAPDSSRLMTTCLDGKARVWPLPPSDEASHSLPQLGTFRFCDFSHDRRLVAIGGHRDVVIWQLPQQETVVGYVKNWLGGRRRPMPSFDGRLATPAAWHETPFATLGYGNKTLTVVEMASGQPAGPKILLDGNLFDSCLCADNRRVAAACIDGRRGSLSIHDVPTGDLLVPPVDLPDLPISMAARPGNSQVAVLCKGGQLLVIDTKDGSQSITLSHPGWSLYRPSARVEYSPDGQTLITVTTASMVLVRDADTGRVRFPAIEPVVEAGLCRTIAVSPDSRYLATAVTGKNFVQVWDLSTGKPAGPALPHPGDFYGLFSVEFSPDSSWLLSGHKDGRMRLWDWKAAKLVIPPMQHSDEVYDVKFLSSRHALAAVRHGTIHLWDLATGKIAAPPVNYPTLSGLPDDSTAAIGLAGKNVIAGAHEYPVIDFSSLVREPIGDIGSLRNVAELATGRTLQLGELSTLTQSDWGTRWAMHQQTPSASRSLIDVLTRKLDQSPDAAAGHLAAKRAARHGLLEELVDLRPSVPQLHRYLAREHRRQGNDTRAKEHYAIAKAEIQKRLDEQPDDPILSSELAALILESRGPIWTPIEPSEMRSNSGATLRALPDGSILAGPGDCTVESYDIGCVCPLRRVTAFRIDVLPHPSLPGSGPGWGSAGNFHLTELQISLQRASGQATTLAVASAAADYVRQLDARISTADGPAGVSDNDHRTQWDVLGQLGRPHSLVLQLAEPIELDANDRFDIRLDFRDSTHKNHRLGRFKLSATDRENAIDHERIRFAVNGDTMMSGRSSLAAAYLAVSQAARALEILQAPNQPTPVDVGERLLLTAKAQHGLGQQVEAMEACGDLIDWLQTNRMPRVLHPLVEEVLMAAGGLDHGRVSAALTTSQINSELTRLALEIGSGTASVPKYHARATYYSRLGRWRDSADDFHRAVEINPASHYPWLQLAPVMLLAGEEERYHAACKKLIHQFRDTNSPNIADVVCKVSLLKPGHGEFSQLPVETLRNAVKDPAWAHYHPWFIACCALVSYREGEAQQAIEWARKLDGGNLQAQTLALVVQALAEHQLGQSDTARATLAKAKARIPEKLRTLGTDDYRGALPVSAAIVHHDWLIPEVLRREAEGLLDAKN
jgi:serine/threonine protein kinase/WD40 repeat protein/tetratricopeptide (TPR) repeat protein